MVVSLHDHFLLFCQTEYAATIESQLDLKKEMLEALQNDLEVGACAFNPLCSHSLWAQGVKVVCERKGLICAFVCFACFLFVSFTVAVMAI